MAQQRLTGFFGPAGPKRKREEAEEEEEEDDGVLPARRRPRPQLAQRRRPLTEVSSNVARSATLAGPARPVFPSGPYQDRPWAAKGDTGAAVNAILDIQAEARARGAPKKSGLQRLTDKSRVVKGAATVKSNPVAVSFGLGDCLIAAPPRQDRGTRGRPYEKVAGSNILTYHLTWAAANGRIPVVSDSVPTEYSHRCHNFMCIEERHGVWETGSQNKARAVCARDGSHRQDGEGRWVGSCPHDPPCLTTGE
jgi:hypothetical protein